MNTNGVEVKLELGGGEWSEIWDDIFWHKKEYNYGKNFR